MKKSLVKYLEVLGQRIYRPVKPAVNPLLRQIKLVYVLLILAGLVIGGSLWNGWQVTGREKAAWWPWSTKSHAEMALVWFENGEEEKAVEELRLANKLVMRETVEVREALTKAESKVKEPGRIRQEIESWEKVLEEKPYFRDVLLRLALLNYQIYEDDKAKDYFEKADYLDPNNEEVQEVGKIISCL